MENFLNWKWNILNKRSSGENGMWFEWMRNFSIILFLVKEYVVWKCLNCFRISSKCYHWKCIKCIEFGFIHVYQMQLLTGVSIWKWQNIKSKIDYNNKTHEIRNIIVFKIHNYAAVYRVQSAEYGSSYIFAYFSPPHSNSSL